MGIESSGNSKPQVDEEADDEEKMLSSLDFLLTASAVSMDKVCGVDAPCNPLEDHDSARAKPPIPLPVPRPKFLTP